MADLQRWLKPLKLAFTIEAEHGFQNILGRGEHFDTFVSRELVNPPSFLRTSDLYEKLDFLSKGFNEYSIKSDKSRRRLISDSRLLLYNISKLTDVVEKVKPPRLKLIDDKSSSLNQSNSGNLDLSLESYLSEIPGIGTKNASRLLAIGLVTIKDLLNYYPRDYVDYSSLCRIKDLQAGEAATIVATVRRCSSFKSPKKPNLSILELHLQDQTGRIKITRFFAGRRFSKYSYLKSQTRLYPEGSTVAVSGLVKSNQFGKTFQEPIIEVMDSSYAPIKSKSIGRLVPIYSLTEGLASDRLRDLIQTVLPVAANCPEPFPKEALIRLSLVSRFDAILKIHKPVDKASLKSARRRLVFDEFFFLQLGLLRRRADLRRCSAPALETSRDSESLVGRFLHLLTFNLTRAQERVLSQIEADLVKTQPMSRLVQGDVGSGKTVVAIAALLNAVQAGWQGAFMAPTEVLALQHYHNLCKFLPNLHVTVDLLTGATPRSRRTEILSNLSNGTLKLLVGTHALIEDPVSFSRLGLVVIDEQHRFGVHQRNRLLAKGLQPHLLTMTATPIPRTLALSLHGDLDVSQIDELPPGRKPVKTTLISSTGRDQAYQLIRDQVSMGQSAYFVLPLVDESEKLDLRSAVEVHKQLKEEVFPEFKLGLLHGRMNSIDKQSIINDFVLGKIQVLVSTTVVEVGVDVPNASVMVIDHADRFGLAQLHQLRGRVGRGAQVSHCVLINDSSNPLAKERLEVLVRTNDGFEISEIDLRLRGPGQVLGTRQSGLPDFALASLVDDGDILEEAREEALHLLGSDPELLHHKILREMLDEHWNRLSGNAYLN